MKKKNFKKTNRVGKERKLNQNVLDLLERGNDFGQTLIGIMAQFAYDWKRMGIAAIGLAKAVAALKTIARDAGVEIEGIFNSELAYFEEEFSLDDFDLTDTDKK